ncbi:ABA4-like family protein [Algoriphagus namhaensis]
MELETIFSLVNSAALLSWIFLFIFLRKKWIYQLIFSGVFVLMALTYLVFIFQGLGGESEGGFNSLAEVKALFGSDEAVLAGWIHYLVFDLFVGMWIAQDGSKRGINRWILLPCLLFTFMLGPTGLLIYLIIRSVKLKRYPHSPFDESLVS